MPEPAGEAIDILLVDDQPSRLITYEAILGPLGHRMVKAGSGLEALQRLMEREYAVISTKLLAGRTVVHVFDDHAPGDGFEPVEPQLEDVYFSAMSGHLGTRRQVATVAS